MKIGFLSLLALIFITLKLTGYIAWSWVWVLAPLWGGFVVAFVVMFIVAVFVGLGKTSHRNIRRP